MRMRVAGTERCFPQKNGGQKSAENDAVEKSRVRVMRMTTQRPKS